MSVRIVGSTILLLAAMVGSAQASSLVLLGPPSATPSVVRLAAIDPSGAADIRSSVMALGEPMPDVTYEKVAALPDQETDRHGPAQLPMIIRGGVVGGAFDTPGAAPAPKTTATPAATAPASASRSGAAMPPDGTRSSKKVASSAGTPAPSQATPIPGVGKLK